MSHHEAFLQAIIANPDDDTPRLVYADYLDERGDPERAEFIRVQCERARLPVDDSRRPALVARETELRRDHAWEAELPEFDGIRWGDFERGFASSIRAHSAGAFLAHAEEICRLAPLRRMRVAAYSPEEAERLVDCPQLAAFAILSFGGHEHGTALARALARSPFTSRLEVLDLKNCFIRLPGAATLARSAGLDRLRVLNLNNNSIGSAGAQALAASPHLTGLTDLCLEANHIEDPAGVALARSPSFTGLVRLELHSNRLGLATARAFADGPDRPALRHFSLGSNRLHDSGAVAFAAWPGLRRFDYLCLAWNPIGNDGVRCLADSPHLAGVNRLVLGYSQPGRFDYRKHLMPGLFNLYNNRITAAGIQELARSPYLSGMRSLELWCNNADEAALRYLSQRRTPGQEGRHEERY